MRKLRDIEGLARSLEHESDGRNGRNGERPGSYDPGREPAPDETPRSG